MQAKVSYVQTPHLFRNLGAKKFAAVTATSGAPLQVPIVGRGAAYGDYDNDGDLDRSLGRSDEAIAEFKQVLPLDAEDVGSRVNIA